MSYEQPQSKSEGYGFHEGWEIAELVGEIPPLPFIIMGDLFEGAFEDLQND